MVAADDGVRGRVNARAVPFPPTDVTRPTVKAGGWPDVMAATDDSIRCAILTAERRDYKERYKDEVCDVLVFATDGRALQAARWAKGWTISLSHDGQKIDRIAARHGSKHDRPVPSTFFGRLLAGKELFSWQETENIMKQFVTSPGDPATISWVGERER